MKNYKNDLKRKLAEQFRAKDHQKKVIYKYWIPEELNTRNLLTLFTNKTDPDAFAETAANLAKIAKNHGAQIVRKSRFVHGEEFLTTDYIKQPVDNSLCFRTHRLETDFEFEERLEREEYRFVEDGANKIRMSKKKAEKERIKSKLTPRERKVLGIK